MSHVCVLHIYNTTHTYVHGIYCLLHNMALSARPIFRKLSNDSFSVVIYDVDRSIEAAAGGGLTMKLLEMPWTSHIIYIYEQQQ